MAVMRGDGTIVKGKKSMLKVETGAHPPQHNTLLAMSDGTRAGRFDKVMVMDKEYPPIWVVTTTRKGKRTLRKGTALYYARHTCRLTVLHIPTFDDGTKERQMRELCDKYESLEKRLLDLPTNGLRQRIGTLEGYRKAIEDMTPFENADLDGEGNTSHDWAYGLR